MAIKFKPLIKKNLMLSRAKIMKTFCVTGGLAITIALYVISKVAIQLDIDINLPTKIVDSDNNDNTSLSILSFLLLNNKITGYKKYIIIFMLSMVEVFILFKYASRISSILSLLNSDLFLHWLIVGMCVYLSLIILYNLTIIFLMVKFSSDNNKDLVLSKYLPKFIKTYLTELNNFSKYKEIFNDMVGMYIKMTLFFFISLVFFICLLFFMN